MAIACVDRTNMGLDFGLGGLNACFPKMKNRWLLQIDGVSGVANALPPFKAGRPQLDFKEQQIAHLVQQIYYPIMVDWKPIQLTLYDILPNKNPVFEWIQQIYDPQPAGDKEWQPVYNSSNGNTGFKRNAILCMYDGCGSVSESWVIENSYVQSANWEELVMNEVAVMTVSITLRYDRAYIKSSSNGNSGSGAGGGAPGGNNGGGSPFSNSSNPSSPNQPQNPDTYNQPNVPWVNPMA